MNRHETRELWRKCQEAKECAIADGVSIDDAQKIASGVWNEWANRASDDKRIALNSMGVDFAKVDFSSCIFKLAADRCDVDSPFTVYLTSMYDFNGFIFPGAVSFVRAKFNCDIIIDGCSFRGDVDFMSAKFGGDLWITNGSFDGVCGFNGCIFSGIIRIARCIFSCGVYFDRSSFSADTFIGDVLFSDYVSFLSVECEDDFRLEDIVFGSVPDFVLAKFREPPQLDFIHIAPPRQWPTFPDRRAPAAYRALKRLAIAGHDRDRELEFFAGEIRASRKVSDFPWLGYGLPAFGRFWIGMAYDVFSDFGRSVARPLMAWLAVALVCSVYYLSQAKEVEYTFLGLFRWAECRGVEDPQTSAPAEALHLAFRNGLIVLYSGDESTHRTYGCLYGYASPEAKTPYVPASVSAVSAIQKLFSLLFIFLAGLGLRNMLKMK